MSNRTAVTASAIAAVSASRVYASGLVDRATAAPRLGNIRGVIRELTTRPLYAWSFAEALAAVIAAARAEAEHVRAVRAARAAAERRMIERRRDAEALAAAYD